MTYTKFALLSGVSEPHGDPAAGIAQPANHPAVETFDYFFRSLAALKSSQTRKSAWVNIGGTCAATKLTSQKR